MEKQKAFQFGHRVYIQNDEAPEVFRDHIFIHFLARIYSFLAVIIENFITCSYAHNE